MAGTPQEVLNFVELTDEEKAVLQECRINSVYFRGLPLGVCSVLLLRQAVNGGYFPHIKRFAALYYTGLFGFGFLAGVSSYKNTCVEKIMKLENSRLADQVKATQMAGNRRSHWETERVPYERQDVELQELRKKHRERWTPPSMSPSGTSRSDQVRQKHDGESHSKAAAGSSDTPLSWTFDMSNSSAEGSNQEGQRGNNLQERPSYRQGPPPRKNKYGDVIEG
ncbi:uncharacterized protein [Porites lutea]|uniref:uncharacterized protein isoform X3 n=1 Tax=Porites lutea TaxID=51062 RepID=UPI003CC60365